MRRIEKILVTVLFCIINIQSYAQQQQIITQDGLVITYKDCGNFFELQSVTNNSNDDISLYYLQVGKTEATPLKVHKDKAVPMDPLPKCIKIWTNGKADKPIIEKNVQDQIAPQHDNKKKDDVKVSKVKDKNSNNPILTVSSNPASKKQDIIFVPQPPQQNVQKVATGDFLSNFRSYLMGSSSFFSDFTADSLKIVDFIDDLTYRTDRETYIQENELNTFIANQKDSVNKYRSSCDSLVNVFLTKKYKYREFENKDDCVENAKNIITQKMNQREQDVKNLEKALNNELPGKKFDWSSIDWKMVLNGLLILFALGLLMILFRWFRKKKTKVVPQKDEVHPRTTNSQDAKPSLVRPVGKTVRVLKKQSLEDVIDNGAYLPIDCSDFCNNSAVRRIYIKNTCIKGIYNMYAEDLRNPTHPNEDGCMVLGRWVYDKESDEYYVSLEDLVFPGDDAVFSEYELNFGAKIKLKKNNQLSQLRKNTNLQYDLTCWVHSHPGLGVFFSNSDVNVQMQNKDITHPRFLTAIVVDILTPDQELGIFTFRKDYTINSRDDLKKMYSLEALYKWAVESEKKSININDYYNTLVGTQKQSNDCHGIYLNASSVIDICQIVDSNQDFIKGMVYGTSMVRRGNNEFVVTKVSDDSTVKSNDLIGCLAVVNSYSIPAIRRIVAEELSRIKFVLVYTTSDGLLTSIPVLKQELMTEIEYNGEQKLEDLKIWTRRKR